MNPNHGLDAQRYIAKLRREFDESFARPTAAPEGAHEELLAILVDNQLYVLRMSQLSGIYADKVITAVPSTSPHLVGVAAFRGNLVAVFDLPSLLGHGRATSHRWIVQLRDEVIGFGFSTFVGYVRLSTRLLGASTARRSRGALVAVEIDGTSYALVELPELVSVVDNRLSATQET